VAKNREFKIKISAGVNKIILRRATLEDKKELIALYCSIYGNDYPLEIITDDLVLTRCITDDDYFWPVITCDGKIYGSVIFECSTIHRLSKVFGAVIHPQWQGYDLMRKAIVAGLDYLADTGSPVDVVYATTRTVSPAPEKLVRRIGFKTLGIFPNVRKVRAFETHGFNIYFRKGVLARRIIRPKLIPEVAAFFNIAKDICEFSDMACIEPYELPAPEPFDLDFSIYDNREQIVSRFNDLYEQGKLKFSFFPFHEPDILLKSKDGNTELFLYHNENDNYCAIIGLRTDRIDICGLLQQACIKAAALGLKYIELLVSAMDTVKQKQAVDAHFVPSAYFPAAKLMADGKRMDYLCFSRSYETLDFTSIKLSGDGQRFLEAFTKCWYWHLLKDEPDYSAFCRNED